MKCSTNFITFFHFSPCVGDEELIMVSKCELWFSGDGVWLPHPQEKHWRPEYTSIDTNISQIQKIKYSPTIWQILMEKLTKQTLNTSHKYDTYWLKYITNTEDKYFEKNINLQTFTGGELPAIMLSSESFLGLNWRFLRELNSKPIFEQVTPSRISGKRKRLGADLPSPPGVKRSKKGQVL